ncbi:TPA: helix-turn-helix domain-containing protein [Streptococcus suis]|nr:helix-turn-helix domain-containing protein [Streptococcus suis]HEM3622030.1 helix-turn-helix domain-containing protein [Streptococcus suis]HEM3626460.1 helix-turn-helix domain-containing protein [Streptococcus suis]HEM3631005.1 helix-turn-helix domain-containing protein [Streptococcus suis]HEM3639499.1 helix-turn-helix domain-containing protein [Streptococcus suis]
MTSFSDRLKELRKKNQLTQQELADKVGTNRVNITKWETGRTEPTLENIIKLAHILDTTTDELLGRQVNFGDKIILNLSKYDLSNLKTFSEQELYDLKATIVLELLDESVDTVTVKKKLTVKNKLDDEEEIILDTVISESKAFADEVIAFEKFRKAKRKFKWPWQKD